MHNLLSSLLYLEEKKVVHRNLNPENLMLTSKTNDSHLKMTDFYFATFLTENEPKLYLQCGTPGYIAPEVFTNEGYGCPADVFSSGAIMYLLLTGRTMFRASSVFDLMEINKNCVIEFP
jgi:calcium/calmodulin-dependent protein kinase I